MTDTCIIRVDLSYDGRPFNGWAIQPNVPSVQGYIEHALEVLLTRKVRITVAGRTDTGVHARGQVISFQLGVDEWFGLSRGKEISPEESMRRRLMGILAMHLQENAGSIVINRVRLAPKGFNARFSALARCYSYRIVDDPAQWDPLAQDTSWWVYRHLDIDAMNEGAQLLLGQHDFIAYCKPRPGTTTVRTLKKFSFERKELSEKHDSNGSGDGFSYIQATIEADAFCHNMVRALISGTAKVGLGEHDPGWLKDRLDSQVKDKHYALAPARGLILEHVKYPSNEHVLERAETTRQLRNAKIH